MRTFFASAAVLLSSLLLGSGLRKRRSRHASQDSRFLIKEPKMRSGVHAGIVFISGAATSNTAYEPVIERIQEEAALNGVSLFAGAPWFAGNTPNPVDLKWRINDVLGALGDVGMDTDAKVFMAGHSLGTVFLQDHVTSRGDQVAGQILMGGFLLRKHISPEVNYSIPTLTLAGELDGLSRVTRMAEAHYHQKGRQDLPVAVLMGQNHHQFASGPPPSNVRNNDIEAEVDDETAHGRIAELVSDFMAIQLGNKGTGKLDKALKDSAEFFEPIVRAYELEGSRHFNMPAQVGGPQSDLCNRGKCPGHSAWAPEAQKVISANVAPLEVSNMYVVLAGSPATGQNYHLPNITNEGGTLHISTYSECYWNGWWDELKDSFDTGFTFTSAQEIGTKLYSRQCTLNVGMGENVSFDVDDTDFCAITNQKAYQWALDNAPPSTRSRFDRDGKKLVMGLSKQNSAGPLWVMNRLKFAPKSDGTVEVISQAQKTQQNYWKDTFGPIPRPPGIPDPGCYHYCKLLSPARAMEWMLVDGLKQ